MPLGRYSCVDNINRQRSIFLINFRHGEFSIRNVDDNSSSFVITMLRCG